MKQFSSQLRKSDKERKKFNLKHLGKKRKIGEVHINFVKEQTK